MDVVNQILLRSMVIFLLVGSVLAFVVGMGLLIRPAAVARWNERMSRWVGTERIEEQLDRPRWVERITYRHHRVVGLAVFLGACFILYTFLFTYNVRTMSAMMPAASWRLMDVLLAVLIVGSVVAAVVGLAILTKPSALKEFEKTSNRWIATDGVSHLFNAMHHGPEQRMLRHARPVGLFFVAGSLFTMLVLGRLLLGPGLNL